MNLPETASVPAFAADRPNGPIVARSFDPTDVVESVEIVGLETAEDTVLFRSEARAVIAVLTAWLTATEPAPDPTPEPAPDPNPDHVFQVGDRAVVSRPGQSKLDGRIGEVTRILEATAQLDGRRWYRTAELVPIDDEVPPLYADGVYVVTGDPRGCSDVKLGMTVVDVTGQDDIGNVWCGVPGDDRWHYARASSLTLLRREEVKS